MTHAHEHDHSSYYLEQLCTIATCAAFGLVCVLLWYLRNFAPPPPPNKPMLDLMLDPKFHLPVLLGGITLLGLAAFRAVAVWSSAGKVNPVHNHDHEHDMGAIHDHDHGPGCEHDHGIQHGPDCGHDHGHEHSAGLPQEPAVHVHAGNHDHGHDHGWNPWRYAVLLVPVVLYFLGLPVQATEDIGSFELEANVKSKEGGIIALEFYELRDASSDSGKRDILQGRIGQLTGQYARGPNPKAFTLIIANMKCCFADRVVQKSEVAIIAPENVQNIRDEDWIEVEGQIQFPKRTDKGGYMPVIVVPSMDKIRKSTQLR